MKSGCVCPACGKEHKEKRYFVQNVDLSLIRRILKTKSFMKFLKSRLSVFWKT